MKLDKLYQLVSSKQNNSTEKSYTASLLNGDKDRIIQKVGEEAIEVVIASKNNKTSEMVYEISDLLYHLVVLMVSKDISFKDIEEELDRRHSS